MVTMLYDILIKLNIVFIWNTGLFCAALTVHAQDVHFLLLLLMRNFIYIHINVYWLEYIMVNYGAVYIICWIFKQAKDLLVKGILWMTEHKVDRCSPLVHYSICHSYHIEV